MKTYYQEQADDIVSKWETNASWHARGRPSISVDYRQLKELIVVVLEHKDDAEFEKGYEQGYEEGVEACADYYGISMKDAKKALRLPKL